MAKFLQALVVLPGAAAHATLFEIYFKDPFLAYAYVASIPFFAVLCQAFRTLSGNILRWHL